MFVREEVNNIHLQQCRYIKSNKNIKVKLFKFENKDIYKYLEDNYGIKFNIHNYVNSNPLKNKYKHINIKKFFANDDIVKLILKYRKEEFEMFGYSTKIEDLY